MIEQTSQGPKYSCDPTLLVERVQIDEYTKSLGFL